MKTNGIRLYSTKNGWTFPWFSWSFTVGVKKYSFWCPPKWLISFHIVFFFFKLTEGYPHDRCRRTMKKTTLQWKPMELGGVPIKKRWIFPLRLIFYVCSSARNWVSSMYKGIDQFPLGSSDPGYLKFLNWRTFQEKKVPWNDQFLFILYLKNEFFKLT